MEDFLRKLDARLEYFSARRIRLLPPAPEEAMAAAEAQLNCSFSPEHKEFLRAHNGGQVLEINLRGVQLLGERRIPKGMDMAAQNLENRSHEWWPLTWLEVGSDGFGNFYVADLGRQDEAGEYPILFVDHEALGREGAASEFAPDYFGFLDRAVGEMIELYNPDGKLKSLSRPD